MPVTPAPSRSRLIALRRAKWASGLVAAVAVAAAGLLALSPRDEETPGDGAADSPSPQRPFARADPAAARPLPPTAPVHPGPRRRFTVRVIADGQPAPGVFVRAIRHDAKTSTATELGDPARTDPAGLATLEADEPLPAGAWLEMALADSSGARHGFVPLDRVASSPSTEPATVELPAGGSLRIDVQGLPSAEMPRRALVVLQAPYGDWLGLFEDTRVHAAADGGPSERHALPSTLPVALDAAGMGSLAHVPDTFVVAVRLESVPDGFIAEEVSCSGPSMPASEGRVLRVPQGRVCTYTLHWKPLPKVRVLVTSEDGRPIPKARVGAGLAFRGPEGGAEIAPQVAVTDAAGAASVALWSGTALPDWRPEEIVVAAIAEGRAARVVRAPGGRWYGNEVAVTLPASAGGSFTVAGSLAFPADKPAAGVPLLLGGAGTWNGERLLAPLSAVADAEGKFSFSVPEDARALFEFGGSLCVRVDGDRLENLSDDALWRGLWPSLPRAVAEPTSIALPPPRGTSRTSLTLSLPQ